MARRLEPAWTALAFQSFIALRNEPSATNRALSIANDLTREELDSSAVARNALVLIRRAGIGDGLKLTATGNLTRSVVAEMIDLFDWPDFDKAEAFEFSQGRQRARLPAAALRPPRRRGRKARSQNARRP